MGSICRDSFKKTNKFSLFCYFFWKKWHVFEKVELLLH